MGRLRPEALIGNELHDLHYRHDTIYGQGAEPLEGESCQVLTSYDLCQDVLFSTRE